MTTARRLGIVTLVGEPGVGTTRLTAEFAAHAQVRVTTVSLHAAMSPETILAALEGVAPDTIVELTGCIE